MPSNYNIGPRIGIEGEAEFRKQISQINSAYKSMDSYLQAITKDMEANGRSQDALKARANGLRQQIDLQAQKYNQLAGALEKAKAQYGENSQEVMRYEGAMLDVQNTTNKLVKALAEMEQELEDMADGIERVGDESDDSGEKVLSFGDMLKAGIASGAILNAAERIGDLIVDIGREAVDAAAEVKAANSQFSQTFGNLETTATAALRAVSSETGIATTRLQSGYTALYAFTKSVGGDSTTALSIAQRALTAAADSAAYYDRTMEDATETLQSFLKGNYANDAALGIAATETTRNAMANQLYAKSFKDLTEAQKVDTLLAMVEAGNKASGALGQAAREADSWTNVTGELAENWRQLLAVFGSPILDGLTPMVQGLSNALGALAQQSSFQKLRADTDGFRDGLAAADAALESSNSQMQATAGLAAKYVERLEAIEAAGLRTAEAQTEYAQTVELLNALMPELGLTINDVTGRLDQNTGAIRDNIQSLKAQAEQQARNAYYQSIIDAYTEAYAAQYAAQQKLIELETRRNRLLEQGAVAYDTISYAQAGSTAALTSYNATLSKEDQELAAVNYELRLLESELNQLGAALSESEGKLDAANAATAGLAEASAGAVEESERLTEAQQTLATAYAEARTAARENIDSQIGLFDKLGGKSDWTAKKIIKNWKSQREAFAQYEDNLKKAVDMGLDEALVQQLADGSEQSMQILHAMVNDTKIGVNKINAEFRRLSEAKDGAADAMAEVTSTVDTALAQLLERVRPIGYDTGAGIAKGVRDSIPAVENAFTELAKRGQGAYLHTMDQHSPSRVMRTKGKDSGLGAALGVEDAIPSMEKSMTALATAGVSAYTRQQVAAAADYPTIALATGAVGGGGSTTNNHSVAYGGVSINVYAQQGQSVNAIADAVIQQLNVELVQRRAAFG